MTNSSSSERRRNSGSTNTTTTRSSSSSIAAAAKAEVAQCRRFGGSIVDEYIICRHDGRNEESERENMLRRVACLHTWYVGGECRFRSFCKPWKRSCYNTGAKLNETLRLHIGCHLVSDRTVQEVGSGVGTYCTLRRGIFWRPIPLHGAVAMDLVSCANVELRSARGGGGGGRRKVWEGGGWTHGQEGKRREPGKREGTGTTFWY